MDVMRSSALNANETSSDLFIVRGVTRGGPEALRKRVENVLLIGVPLAGTLATPFWIANHGVTWIEIVAFVVTYAFVGVGVGVGLHRYFSHRSFVAPHWLAVVLAIAGSMAFQGSVLRWIADHRRHHAHTDVCGDVHSPHVDEACAHTASWRGFLHAHIGWMFDDVVTRYDVFAKDLLRDPLIMFFHRTQAVWPVLLLLMTWAFGYVLGGPERAWGCVLIAGCLRTTIFHNVVWAVNSVGHTHGYQTYALGNNSMNNTLLAWLTFGDGWHNNHHRFPRSAHHGLLKHEVDWNGRIIDYLERMGIVRDVIRLSVEKSTAAGPGLPVN